MVPTGVIGVVTEAWRASQAGADDGFNEEPVEPAAVAPKAKGQKSGAARAKPDTDEDP